MMRYVYHDTRADRAPDMPDRTPAGPVLTSATARLADAGMPAPRVDAELLACHVLRVSRGRLPLADAFDADQHRRYRDLVGRRAAGTPLQHLTGTAGFRRLELSVGPGVFVPRPETELLVDAAGAALAGTAAPVVVDLCAGSGALGLSMAAERPGGTVYLVELDADALAYLRRNAADRAAAGDPPAAVVCADATDAGLADALSTAAGRPLAGAVDAVLANPPYVPSGTRLPVDVATGDPHRALFAGADGLAVLRPLVARAAELLRPGGVLVVEHDDTHATVVPDLLRGDGRFVGVEAHRDLAGRPRYATGHRA